MGQFSFAKGSDVVTCQLLGTVLQSDESSDFLAHSGVGDSDLIQMKVKIFLVNLETIKKLTTCTSRIIE